MIVQDIPSLQYVYFWNSVEMEVAASLQLLHVKAFLRFSLRHGFSHLAMQNHLTQSWQRWWTPSLKEAGPESLCGLQWILGRSWRLQRLHCLGMWVKFLIQYGWWLCLKLCTLGFTSMHLPLAIQCYTGIQSQDDVSTTWVLYSLWPRIEGWDRRDRHNCWICLHFFEWQSKEMASIEACTDRAFQAYLTSPATEWRTIRLVVTLRPGCNRQSKNSSCKSI